jgi:two-component system NarL family sensor kinase
MKKIFFGSLLLIAVCTSSNAQQHLVDSISKELKQDLPDTTRAISMMRLAIDYELVDTAKSHTAYLDAIRFAKSKKLNYQLGRIYQNHAFLYANAARYTEAISCLDTAILYYQRSNHPNTKKMLANTYNDLANKYRTINETEKAVDYYLKGIGLLEQAGVVSELVTPYCNLANMFGDIGNPKQQNEYGYKALAAAKKTGIAQKIFMACFTLANGYVHTQQNNLDMAKKYIDSAGIYFDKQALINSPDIQVSYYLVRAQVFRQLEQFDSAEFYFKKCYAVAEQYNYSYGKAESQLQLGGISIQQKKYEVAEKYLLSGIRLADSIGYYNMLDEGYRYMADVYAATGRYKQAYEYHQKYKEVSDSVTSLDAKKYIEELEKKYEITKKDKQLLLQQTQLEKRKTLIYILVASAIALLLFSLLIYRNFNHRRKLQQQRIIELETKEQLTATEAILKGEEQERTRLAKDLHDGLGGMLSGIKFSFQTMKGNLVMTPENQQVFERSMDMIDGSIKEMRRVAHNMMPEALVKFGLSTALKDFCNEINQSGALNINYQSIGMENADIEQTTAVNIYRIIQELINNTLKHASARNAIVQISKKDGAFSITVEDDGKGFDPQLLKGSKGIGWTNIQSRVDYLKGTIDIQSEPGKGVSVHVETGG